MRRDLGILLILVISSSFVQAVDECPLQCDCTDDFSIVTCRDMEKFPVFDFASKVKILDLTYGNIRRIHKSDVIPYINLEKLFISHNPLDCDDVTTRTIKYVLRETMKLKSFDGHKIKCPQMVTIMKNPYAAEDNQTPEPVYHVVSGSHHACLTPEVVIAIVFLTLLGLAAVCGVCWLIITLSTSGMETDSDIDSISDMEEGMEKPNEGAEDTDDVSKHGCMGEITKKPNPFGSVMAEIDLTNF